MDRTWKLGWVMLWLTLLWPVIARAQGRSFTDRAVPGMRQADRHNPFSRGYVDMTPGGFARRQSGYVGSGGFSYGRSYTTYYYPPEYGGSYFGSPTFYDYASPFEYGVDYGWSPAEFIPPEVWFGQEPYLPSPVLPPLAAPAPAAGNPGAAIVPPAGGIPPIKESTKPRASNAESLARAGRFIDSGDDHFAEQRYRDANQRYRSATESAPDLLEAHFRQGQALLATGVYDLAVKAFKRGIKLNKNWPQADFELANLYGQNQIAKTAHLEAVATAAGQQPHDANLLLLVALELHFDGQAERARPFFKKAAEQLGDEGLDFTAALNSSSM